LLKLVAHLVGVSSPSPGPYSNTLSAVVASSTNDVWAVGNSSSGGGALTLIEHWNGTTWSVVSSPTPNNNAVLNGVVAISAKNVWAVGYTFSSVLSGGSVQQTLIEQWNGSTWSVVSSPNVGPGNNQLNGVIALSPSLAWAVGYSVQQNGPPQTLSEYWNGTQWSFVTNPNQGTFHSLSGVAARSTSDVWAVGQYVTSSNNFDTLTEHWNGSAWSIIPSPNSMSQLNDLLGVAVIAANNVWAVGNSNADQQTLVEHWNGTMWSIVPSPSPGVNGNSLNAVVAVSANDVRAVGYQYNSSGIQQTLIEQWNGSAWSVVPSPSPGPSMNELMGVTALSAANVWAVGYHDGSNTLQTLTEHWNGSNWSVVASPNAVSGSSLYGISATSASNVWAVGTYGTFNGVYYTLIEHWNGTAWSVVTSPNPGSAYSILNGVAAISGSSAWAVGVYSNSHFNSHTLTEHWNGSAWSVVTSPDVPTPRP
jgi:hypothetical protein